MKQLYLLVIILRSLLPRAGRAQLAETFADGNFTQNPAWTGEVGSFGVVGHLYKEFK